MELKITKVFCQAATLGIVAGMRTFMAPAVASHLYSRRPGRYLKHSPLSFMQTIIASKVFKVLAAGELVGDKLPNAPNRTGKPGLIGRTLSGMLVGATVYQANGRKPVIGGIIGGAAAAAATFGCFYVRSATGKKTAIPDPVIGAVEDVLAITAGVAVAKL